MEQHDQRRLARDLRAYIDLRIAYHLGTVDAAATDQAWRHVRDVMIGATADPLSPRERAILQLVADNCSNKQIAAQLSIKEVTVKNHLTVVFRKLDASTRLEAVTKAFARGWVRLPMPDQEEER